MLVLTKAGRDGRAIARIQEGAYRGTICLFTEPVEAGVEVDVMITGAKFVQGEPTCFFVREIQDVDLDNYVMHSGFECAGSMCCTTARIQKTESKKSGIITPGRLNSLLYEADNVNSRFYNYPDEPLVPGLAYVDSQNRVYGVYNTLTLRREVQNTKPFIEWLRSIEEIKKERKAAREQEKANENKVA